MTILYSAVDKTDGVESIFLVNTLGVLVAARGTVADAREEIRAAKLLEQITPPFMYSDIERMDDALGLTLIGNW